MSDEIYAEALYEHVKNGGASRMFMALACDGPLNGDYLTPTRAQTNGYTLERWPEVGDGPGEYVWMHEDGNLAEAMIAGNVERIR